MHVLALHIGRSGTEAAIVDTGADPWQVVVGPVSVRPQGQSPDEVVKIAQQCAAQAVETHRDDITGSAIATPGQVHVPQKRVLEVAGMSWREADLAKAFASLPQPLYVDNNARASALAELYVGGGRGVRDFVTVNLDTGLAAGLVLDGRLYRGWQQISGEFGHLTVDCNLGARQCHCGNTGCLETYASGWALVRLAKTMVAAGVETTLRAKVQDGTLVYADIYGAAEEGDSAAFTLLEDLGRYLGIGLASLANIVGPQKIIVSGALARAWDCFQEPMLLEFRRRALRQARQVTVEPTILMSDGCVLAAAAVFRQQSTDEAASPGARA